MENNNNLGQVKISNDVIVTIAGLTDKLLKNNGVKIQIEDGKVTLDVVITVEYGMAIPEVSLKVQENVKNTVETMTGLEVSQVNIQVQEISFKKEKEEKELAKQAKKEEAKLAKQAKKEEAKKTTK